MIKILPYLLILLGLFILFMIEQPIAAGIFFLLGIAMIFEHIWPEMWEADKQNNDD